MISNRPYNGSDLQRKWYTRNREKCISRAMIWQRVNPEEVVIIRKKFYRNHSDKIRADVKTCRLLKSSFERKIINRRQKERRKLLPSIGIILNDSFENSELHHTGVFDELTGKFFGVYIPKSLNRVGHCARVGKERNLDRVNWDAAEFVTSRFDF